MNPGTMQYVLWAGILVVFYFFMIRPQYKKQKELVSYLSKLKKGDKIMTNGGIYGTIYEVEDKVVILEIDNKGTKLTVSKDSISPISCKQ